PWKLRKKEYLIDVPIGTKNEIFIYLGIIVTGLAIIEIADLSLKNIIWVMGLAMGFLFLRRMKNQANSR
ncbi:hypothetical protein, partial [Mycobacterium tuberculosis]